MDDYLRFHITRNIPDPNYATPHLLLISPVTVDLQAVRVRYRVGSISGTVDVVRVKNAQPVDGRELSPPVDAALSLLTSPVLLYGQANHRLIGNITLLRVDSEAAAGYRINRDSSVGLLFAGNLSGLEDLAVTCTFKKVIS